MNNVPIKIFHCYAEECYISNTADGQLPRIVGLKNTIVIYIRPDHHATIDFMFRSNNLDENSSTGYVWFQSFRGEFAIFFEGKFLDYKNNEEFLDWLGKNHPEDFQVMMFHPEIFKEDKFCP